MLHLHLFCPVFCENISPGWDDEFIGKFKSRGYTKFIAYDTLPAKHHYKPGQVGWKKTSTPAIFFAALKESYGEYTDIGNNTLLFERDNIEYHYNTDTETLALLPDGDVLLKGYAPSSWPKKGFFDNRVVFLDCSSGWHDFPNDVITNSVHCHCHDADVCCYLKESFSIEEEEDHD
jgi:hypothetical protein